MGIFNLGQGDGLMYCTVVCTLFCTSTGQNINRGAPETTGHAEM